jgi:hypothetical protein
MISPFEFGFLGACRMATLVLLMSVLTIVGVSLQVACVALHRASPSLRLAESAMEMFGAADYSLDLELRVTAVDATTAGAGARCGAPPPFGVLTSQLTMKPEWSTSGAVLLSPPSVEGGRSIHGNVSELLISRRAATADLEQRSGSDDVVRRVTG